MNDKDVIEQELNLTELFWQILLGWRKIVCLCVVFAVLMGALGYLRSTKSYQAALEEEKRYGNGWENDLKSQMKEDEIAVIEDAKEVLNRITAQENYLESSVYMNLNPYEENVLKLQYFVESDYTYNYNKDNKIDYTGDLVYAYSNYISNDILTQYLLQELSLEITSGNLGELIAVDNSDSSFDIVIRYPDQEILKKISQTVQDFMKQREPELKSSVGSHTLKLIQENQSVVVDQDLIERRNELEANIASMKTQLNTIKTAMTDAQLQLFHFEEKKIQGKTEKESDDKAVSVTIPKPRISLKYILLGIVLGGFFAAVWIMVQFLGSGKLHCFQQLRDAYKIRLFGILKREEQNRMLGIVDHWILRWKRRKIKSLPKEQQLQNTVFHLTLACRKDKVDKLYLTSSEMDRLNQDTLDALVKKLEENGIQAEVGNSICYDAEALKKAFKMEHVLLIEQSNLSFYREVVNEIHMVRDQKIDLIGMIGIE